MMNTISPVKRITDRGFERIDFVDAYGVKCSLQQSSAAECEIPGTSAVWLGTDGPRVGEPMHRMHLSREHAAFLVAQIAAWLATGKFK